MYNIEGEELFYELEGIDMKLDRIIDTLGLNKLSFEIKLMMMEAITNAFFHGNSSEKHKPTCLYYKLKDNFFGVENGNFKRFQDNSGAF